MRFTPLLLVLLSIPAFGQTGVPRFPSTARGPKYLNAVTSTSTSAPGARAGGTVSLFVDVSPYQGLHVYAPGAKGYQAIAVAIGPSPGVRVGTVVYPKADAVFVESPTVRVPVFEKPFRLVQAVTLARTLKAGAVVTVSGVLKYQACDDKVCYAPASQPVSWTLTVR